MTSTYPEQHPDTRIFGVSALGSLIAHGLIIVGLAAMPKVATVQDDPPTVNVTLLPTPEVSPAPPTPEPSVQPHTAMPKAQPLPPPQAPPTRSQPVVPPMQARLAPSVPQTPDLLPLPTPTRPILKDARASQAIKARNLMKMRMPTTSQQRTAALPRVKPRADSTPHIMAPRPPLKEKRLNGPSLPTPPSFSTPQTLTASPSVHTGPIMTRPRVLSSSKPVYPRVARESGWEGTVIVRTLINTNGIPSQVKIQKSCGHPALDRAAQDTIMTWTFRPAKDGNIPITKWVDIPIKFDLKNS